LGAVFLLAFLLPAANYQFHCLSLLLLTFSIVLFGTTASNLTDWHYAIVIGYWAAAYKKTPFIGA